MCCVCVLFFGLLFSCVVFCCVFKKTFLPVTDCLVLLVRVGWCQVLALCVFFRCEICLLC